MEVVTLSLASLNNKTIKLTTLIHSHNNCPDIVLGIATGGVYISRSMKKELIKKGWNGKYYEIEFSRQSTKLKKKMKLKKMFIKLPYVVLNQFRRLEMFMSELLKTDGYNSSREDSIVLSDKLIYDIHNSKTILLVDDAIDTGSTILAIKNRIIRINPSIDVKVAVLTVTHKEPYIKPDYSLFKRVLLRCPWAEDYKGMDKIG